MCKKTTCVIMWNLNCLFAIFALLLCAIGTAQGQNTTCGYPGVPAHCTVEYSNEDLQEKTVATYYCEPGFELLGPTKRVCGADSQWHPEGIPFCVLNVAAGKAPMQISSEQGGIPQRAIDGSTSSFFTPETCTLTKPERVPWWYVNLLEPYMVQLVRLDFGKPCCGNNKPAVIVVRVGNNRPDLGTNPVCNRFSGRLEEGQPLFLPCNPPMPGAFVSVHLEVAAPSQLSICEAFVYTDQALPIERCPQFRDLPPGSTATYNGKCYIFYNRRTASFRDALAICRERGGTLVEESNPALQGFISWELWRRHRGETSQYWMGAVRDQNDRNNWKWLNDEDVTVSFWNSPGGNEDCARFDGSKGWLWSDTNCQSALNFICQHQPKACGRPEQPPNSTMLATDFNVGATVEYTCDEGHLLVGPPARTCLDTGFYSEFPPVCKRIECGNPASIPDGGYNLLNNSVGYLSHVLYYCDDGFEIIGRARLVCDIDERWNGPPPRCSVVQCEPPPSIANGQILASTNISTFGTTVQYICNSGHQILGSNEISCLASGQWNKPPPACKREERSTTPTAPPTIGSTTRFLPPRTTRPRPLTPTPTIHPTYPESAIPSYRTPTRRPTAKPTERTTTPRITTRRPIETHDNHDSSTSHIPHIIVASHPRENQIPGSNSNIRLDQTPKINVPLSIDGERKELLGAKLNMGAVIALGAFGALVFIVAIITTVIILVRRTHGAKHYRHHVSPDCNTVASFDSSSSESRNGLNRYYRQAWENLHESAGGKGHGMRRKQVMEEMGYRREAMKDGSELVVSDVYPARDKKRHHHHHHHRDSRQKEWLPREHRGSSHHNHKPRY